MKQPNPTHPLANNQRNLSVLRKDLSGCQNTNMLLFKNVCLLIQQDCSTLTLSWGALRIREWSEWGKLEQGISRENLGGLSVTSCRQGFKILTFSSRGSNLGKKHVSFRRNLGPGKTRKFCHSLSFFPIFSVSLFVLCVCDVFLLLKFSSFFVIP